MRVHARAPVVAVDLDGTLGDYHRHFMWYLNHIYFPYAGGPYHYRADWKDIYRGEFSSALQMDKATYRDAKLAYRQGGLKRCMPKFGSDDVRMEIQYIRSMGIQVWITTNRPWMRLDNIDKDTKYWIDYNCGEVDGVIFSQEKYHDLIDHVGRNRILGVFDDLPENIEAASSLNLPAVLRRGEHNEWWLTSERDKLPDVVPAIRVLSAFTSIVEEWKENWDAQHPGVL